MTIPPINPNAPVSGAQKTDKAQQGAKNAEGGISSAPRDVVDISEAAQARLEQSQKLDESEARATAQETRDQLADSGISLSNGRVAG